MTKVFPDSPATDGGLAAGQTILKIEGTAVDGKTIPECLQLMRPADSQTVRLEVVVSNGQKANQIELVRRKFLVAN